jgi:hypothetical protein
MVGFALTAKQAEHVATPPSGFVAVRFLAPGAAPLVTLMSRVSDVELTTVAECTVTPLPRLAVTPFWNPVPVTEIW